ncbi:hypothetical protein HZP70_18645 [Elizabethkingia anophelis]|nr:hypothetical protein [Elizabethkingia anophelis]MCT3828715.1 hypothetical protein [Elizabethkingia anophelis]MCT3839555.1 hypothetical protein [Elizabethkingia anophelis]MCT3843201.1 hypothetical protein [Elizabethkingia anophelis]MCT3850363.1 hypothetical protein [Elizabethkingia anophelis]
MKSKMINNIIGVGATLLGLAMAKKGAVKFFESSTYSDFEINDTVFDLVKKSEGSREVAYRLPNENQWTIGYGTSYLFNANGTPLKNHGAVRQGDTLTALKKEMGYSLYSNDSFATELIRNHSKASRYSKVAKDLDSFGVPFKQSFAEALIEVSYGSGSIFGYSSSDIYYTNFLVMARNAKTDLDFAKAYIYYRYSYYKLLTKAGQWSIYQYGWMRRVVRLTCLIIGKNLSENELISYVGGSGTSANKKKLADFVLTNFGLKVIW